LSKRDGDKGGFPVFPLEWNSPDGEIASGYREEGYFPEAFINMLALLGWNPGTEQELFSKQELIDHFSIERVGKSGARFDPEKAKWFNHQYLVNKSDEELTDLFIPLLKEKGIDSDRTWVLRIVSMVKERAFFVQDLWEQSAYFFEAPQEYDKKVIKKRWKEGVPQALSDIKQVISQTESFESTNLEEKIKAYITSNELNMGQIMNSLRLTLVGGAFGVHLFDIMEIIGKEETLNRIQKGLDTIKR
jgi:glutamyl-tRNA synthetase